MKTQFILLATILFINSQTFAHTVPLAKLKYSAETILDYVMAKKKIVRDPNIPLPQIFLKSVTPLRNFQDAIEDQWSFRPDVITNAYSVKTNSIFLLDEKDYYERADRCIDDSLAHELTHYVQVVYQHWDLSDDSLEWDAIDIQTQFREDFCVTHENSRISKDRY